MEVTKWLKPSGSVSRIGDSARVQARNASECRASLEKDDVQADPTTLSGSHRATHIRAPLAAAAW